MRKERNYLNGVELLKNKEREFMERYGYLTLEELMCDLEIPYEQSLFTSLKIVKESLWNIFVDELLEDSDFQNAKVISHFHRNDGTHVFGIKLLDNEIICKHCGEFVSEWVAITFNAEKMEVGIGCQKCHDYEIVQDSSYRGNNIYEVKALIDSYRAKNDNKEDLI